MTRALYFFSKKHLHNSRLSSIRCLSSSAIAICYQKCGDPVKVLKIKTIPLPDVGRNTIKIKFLAAPINPSDLNQIQGVYPIKPEFNPEFGAVAGNEGLAEVVEVGSDINSSIFKTGDWVIPAFAGWGTWRNYAVASPEELIKLNINNGDGKVSILSAATITVNPSTAYRMLKDFIKLNPGDVVIQNGANSGVGQAVIQLCASWGIKTVNIVRMRPNLQDLSKKLKELGATLILTEEDIATSSAKEKIKALMGPPIQLALNCVCGTNSNNMARLLGNDAHLVTYGGMSRHPLPLPASAFIFRNLTSHGYWMTRWHREHSTQERLEMLDELFDLVKQGKLKEPWSTYYELMDTSKKNQEEFSKLVGGILSGHNNDKIILRLSL